MPHPHHHRDNSIPEGDEGVIGARACGTGLSSSTEPASSLGPTGFDPSRVLEFRPDHKGRFDEIVARFADGMVHVETMTDKSCYVGFYWDDGRYCQWWISSGKKLRYTHEDGQEAPPRFTAWGIDRRSDSDGSPKGRDAGLCSDCPPVGYSTNKTRCVDCPRLDGEAATARAEGIAQPTPPLGKSPHHPDMFRREGR